MRLPATKGKDPPANDGAMPGKRSEPTAEDMRKAEREVGENIPRSAVGRGDADVRDVERDVDDEPQE